MFVLKLLGSLSVQRVGAESGCVPLQKRRLELLAILALVRDEGISRERVQAFFWPESTRDRSRHALEQLVYATRRALDADVVTSDGGRLLLNGRIMVADTWAFSDAIRDERWEAAVSAYSGPLLDGFHPEGGWEFERWVDSVRQQLQRDYHRALEALARASHAQDDHGAALAWWLRLAASEPLSSRIAVETIRAFGAAGNPAGGVRHARRVQQLMRTELEIEPAAEIEALAQTLSRAAIAGPPAPRPAASPSDDAPISRDSTEGPVSGRRAREAHPSPGPSRRARVVIATCAVSALVVLVSALSWQNARGVSPRLTHPSEKQIDPVAHAAFLRGMKSWNDRSKGGLDTAVIEFRRAIEREPTYADAHAGLAGAYVLLGYSGYRPGNAMFAKARAAARHAIALDSSVAAAHAALGFELTAERKFDEAEASFLRALALDSSYATAHQWYGILLNIQGRLPDAVRETRIAAQLDPLSLQIQNTYATFLEASGEHAAALRQYQSFVSEEPDSSWVRRNPWLLSNMARIYAANGQFDQGIRTVNLALEILPRHPRPLWDLASIYLRMGRRDLAEQTFARADTSSEHYAAYRAFVYAQSGNLDSAFVWFDRVREWGMPLLIALQSNPELAGVRRDVRFRSLTRRIGLPAASH